MNPAHLNYLRCPHCEQPFELHAFKRDSRGFVEEGVLLSSCARAYPVINGIPRILDLSVLQQELGEVLDRFLEKSASALEKLPSALTQSASTPLKPRHVAGWFFRWDLHRRRAPTLLPERMLDSWFRKDLDPLQPEDIRDCVVLDAGCGMGWNLLNYIKYGSSLIIGVDFTRVIDRSKPLLDEHAHVLLVQADLSKLPIQDETVDFWTALGVLHHLPEPYEGFIRLVSAMKPGARFCCWVYSRELNAFFVHLVEPFKKLVLARLPHRTLSLLLMPLSLLVFFIIQLAYRPLLTGNAAVRNVGMKLPKAKLFDVWKHFSLPLVHGCVFDLLFAPIAHYTSKQTLHKWLGDTQITDPRIFERHGSCWQIYGEKRKRHA